MNCLLAAATAREIAPFLTHYRTTSGRWDNKINIDVLITGIGLTAATYHLTKYFEIKSPDLVIQAGIAGCFTTEIPLGAVVAIKQDTIADESVIELKKLQTLFDLQLIPQNQFPYKKGWLINPTNEAIKKTKLPAVKGISVNQITTSKKMIQLYKDKFNPVTESMEGAALHYVCLMEKIPFVQIRAVSNYVGERNKKKWKINESIINLNNELSSLLHKL
jgi:futalosine hydrolase